MIFKRLTIKNFQPFDDVEQSIELNTKDITLIVGYNESTGGSNGSGKTSWIDALIWVLYGKTRNNVDDVCNKYTGNKDTKVQLDFIEKDDLYEIVRYRKHKKQGNKLYIFKNKIDISYDNNKDTQEEINSIIKISYNAFITSFVFEKENYTPFLKSTPVKRLEIIENMLLDSISIVYYYNKIKELIKKTNTKKEELVSEIEKNNINIASIDSNLMNYKKTIIEKKKFNDSNISRLTKEKEKYLDIDDIEELKQQLTIEKDNLDKISNLNAEKNKLIDSKNKLRQEIILFEIKEITDNINMLENENKDILKNPNICPLCKQPVDKQIADNKINENLSIIDKFNKSIEAKQIELKSETNILDSIIDKINNIDKEIIEANNKIENIDCSHDITLEEIDKMSDKIKDIDKKIEEYKISNNQLINKEFIESRKNEKAKIIKEVEKLNKQLTKINDNYKYLEYFYDIFGNKSHSFKKYLINKILKVLNGKINEFLSIYFPYNITLKFNQSLKETIMVNNNVYYFNEFSSGEKMRIELACVFALFFIIKTYFGQTSNLLILDEILDLNLDTIGIKATIDILNNLKNEGNSIFVISHKANFNNYFSKKIKIIKGKNKVSRIENKYNEQ